VSANADVSPNRPEMAVTLAVLFVLSTAGVWVYRSLEWLALGAAVAEHCEDCDGLLVVLQEEGLMSIAWVPVFLMLGWRPSHLTESFRARDLLVGSGLYAASLALVYGAHILSGVSSLESRGQVELWCVIVFCVLNPVFEEGLFAVVAKLGIGVHAMAGVLLSVGLRYLTHLYQGPVLAFVDVALLGGVFTAYYVRYHRLWPPVIAHAIYNAVELGWLPECAA